MSLEEIKRDSELLLQISKKYMEMQKDKIPKDQLKKIEAYINSLLVNLEKNINENVKRPNKNLSASS